MVKTRHWLWLLCGLIGLASSVVAQEPRQIVVYAPTNENFANPERGFYHQDEPLWLGEERNPQELASLVELRAEGVSLLRWYLLIDEFRTAAIDDATLVYLNEQFSVVRQAGMKVIPRVAYNFPTSGEYPYTEPDAPLEIVQKHIEQLTPLLRANADVIAFMETGFVGAWGEWHSSSNNLVDDDSGPNEASRQIITSLLRALPADRMIALRYTSYKRDIYGPEPTALEESLQQVDKARIGAHNDCFLASFTDWGTYPEDANERAALRDYLRQDNRFVPQGGETCNNDEEAAPYTGCENALADLTLLRFSALNRDYHPGVLQRWREEGCYDEIEQRLGYRLTLTTGDFPYSAERGQPIRIRLNLQNVGFASPYNTRGFEVSLRSLDSANEYRLTLDETPDPRRWWPENGEITLMLSGILPHHLSPGDYMILLRLPDSYPNLHSRPEYSIRLANTNLWEAETGANRLNAVIRVT